MSAFSKLFIIFIILFSSVIYADPYSIILVINEKNASLHLFKRNNKEIKEVISERNISWKKLLDDKRLDPNAHIKILGTANASLDDVKKYIKAHTLFSIDEAKTISAQSRGIYTWLAVNYQEGNFSENSDTLGIIDVGHRDAVIAYATNEKNDDVVQININAQIYYVFSKSFSGLGQNAAREKVNELACYPQGYQTSTKFNFASCANAYANIIKPYHITLPAHDNLTFVVFSGAYYTYTFFGVEDASQGALDARVNNVCDSTWQEMLQEYDGDKYLAGRCANGVFLDQLFYSAFKLQSEQMWVTSQLHNRQKIDWVLGSEII